MSNVSLEKNRGRKGFYIMGSRKLAVAVIVLAIVNLGLVVSAGVLMATKDDTTSYYAITCDSDPIKLNSLGTALVTAKQLLRWANVAAISAYNYNFVNWRQRMDELRPYFSSQGWQGFYPSFQASQVEPMVAKKAMVSAVATDVPVIERRGVLQGRYTWRVAVPLMVTYQTASEKMRENILVRMVISRVPAVQTPRGIAIMQFHATKLAAIRR